MDDSLRGVLVSLTLIGLFITCILNFIVLFPQEQGVTFTGQGQHGYLTMAENNDTEVIPNLDTIKNNTESAYDQWDVTQGFMGTNQLKQSQGGIFTMLTKVFTSISTIAKELFTSNSPIVYAVMVFFTLASAYLFFLLVQFVRSGR